MRRFRAGRLTPLAYTLVSACQPGGAEYQAKWSSGPPLPEPVQELHAAVLRGRIYVAGGITGRDFGSTAVYRLDSAASGWERVADLPAPRHHMPLAVVHDTLYAIGGLGPGGFSPVATLWLYDERADRGGLAAVEMDGRIHAFGGETTSRVFEEHEVYDSRSRRWTEMQPLPTPRHGVAAAVLAGRIYLIGGGPRAGVAQTDVVEIFTP